MSNTVAEDGSKNMWVGLGAGGEREEKGEGGGQDAGRTWCRARGRGSAGTPSLQLSNQEHSECNSCLVGLDKCVELWQSLFLSYLDSLQLQHHFDTVVTVILCCG